MPCTVHVCCFFVDLRTGSYVIGYVGLVWSMVASIIFIVALHATTWMSPSSVVAILAINLCFSLIRVIFSGLLLIGIHQYNRRYVKAFLIYGVVFTVLTIALLITSIVISRVVLDITINLIDILLIMYFWVVIRSYYLSDASKAPQYPVVQPHFVVQQPQDILQQQPQFIKTQRPQYVMPQPPQYVVPQQQNVVQQEAPPMYSKH